MLCFTTPSSSMKSKELDLKKNNLLNDKKNIEQSYKDDFKSESEYVKEQEIRLQKILESMQYIESAKVMITLKSSKEEVVLKNNPYVKEENESDAIYESDEETVLIEDSEGNAKPYVLKEINPQLEGIVVVVKTQFNNMEQEINDVVLALFDIPAHKIKVMNMK